MKPRSAYLPRKLAASSSACVSLSISSRIAVAVGPSSLSWKCIALERSVQSVVVLPCRKPLPTLCDEMAKHLLHTWEPLWCEH